MDKHFIYYHCDQWKMKNSMTVIGVFTEAKLKQIIVEDLRCQDIELDRKSDDEILDMSISTLNSLIQFGHIEEITLNERC